MVSSLLSNMQGDQATRGTQICSILSLRNLPEHRLRSSIFPVDTVNYEPNLHIVLHEPEIPQNTGNIGRTCVAIAAKLWLVEPLGFTIDEKHLRRAGLDYWQYVDLEVVPNWETILDKLGDKTFWYFTKTAKRSIYNTKMKTGDVLVFGAESKGLPPELLEPAGDHCIRIPMRPQVRSLNLATSVAIAAYDTLRDDSELPTSFE